MTDLVHFVTHPEVLIDPAIPVPDWGLSPRGIERMTLALTRPWAAAITSIWSSTERKAIEAADMLAAARALPVRQRADLGENDRSATGYLPREAFEATADLFFAHPEKSIRGWERAIDAQSRIAAAVAAVLAEAPPGDVAIIAHGGVGALLLCHLEGAAISRAWDQPGGGGGNRFSFIRARRVVERWSPMEA